MPIIVYGSERKWCLSHDLHNGERTVCLGKILDSRWFYRTKVSKGLRATGCAEWPAVTQAPAFLSSQWHSCLVCVTLARWPQTGEICKTSWGWGVGVVLVRATRKGRSYTFHAHGQHSSVLTITPRMPPEAHVACVDILMQLSPLRGGKQSLSRAAKF